MRSAGVESSVLRTALGEAMSTVTHYWRLWRLYRKGKKVMSILSKAIEKAGAKSKTTQTVAGSTVAGGGVILAGLAFIRSQWPGLIPWDEEGDAKVLVVLSTVLIPILSRAVAGWRGKL